MEGRPFSFPGLKRSGRNSPEAKELTSVESTPRRRSSIYEDEVYSPSQSASIVIFIDVQERRELRELRDGTDQR